MLLLIDNYDSFTYNLVQYLGELGAQIEVVRNDKVDLNALATGRYDRVVISPGPCTPLEAGLSCEVIRRFGPTLPTLGVCLGHQSIGAVFGGVVERAPEIVHGKVSLIHHNNKGIFAGVDNPFEATRYHSLIVREDSLPACLEKTAWTDNNLVMGLQHKQYPIFGVQFHPESIMTGSGKTILTNFLAVK